MAFKDLVEKRFSVRAYTAQNVEKEKIEHILECARLAPSACNLQPWHFYVITSDEDKLEVVKSYNREWFKKAPIYIIVCGNRDEAWKRSNYDNKNHLDIDLAIACEHIALAVTDLGLGSCWVCNFDPAILSAFLQTPQNIEPIAIFPIGYPDTSVARPTLKRKDLEEMVTWK